MSNANIENWREIVRSWYEDVPGLTRPLTEQEWSHIERRVQRQPESALQWIQNCFKTLPFVSAEWNDGRLQGFEERATIEQSMVQSSVGWFSIRWSDTFPHALALTTVMEKRGEPHEISSILIEVDVSEDPIERRFTMLDVTYKTLSNCVLDSIYCREFVPRLVHKTAVFQWTM